MSSRSSWQADAVGPPPKSPKGIDATIRSYVRAVERERDEAKAEVARLTAEMDVQIECKNHARKECEKAEAEIARLREIEDAHNKWYAERGGIGFACFGSSRDQERAFAKADNDFACSVSAALKPDAGEKP